MRRLTVVLLLLTAVAGGLVLLAGGGDHGAQACGGTGCDPNIIGIDVITTDNTKSTLGAIDQCVQVAPNATFQVDVFLNDVPAGQGFSAQDYYLDFDNTRLTAVSQDHSAATVLLAKVPGSSLWDASSIGASAFHSVVMDYAMPPSTYAEKPGDLGVLGRYTFRATGTGLTALTLSSVILGNSGGVDFFASEIDEVWDASFGPQYGLVAIGVPCPGVTPAPWPTCKPTPTPTPTPDTDGDGIPDAQDACPDEPEDFDRFEDEDGCPEGDFSFAVITDLHIGRYDYETDKGSRSYLRDRLRRVVDWLNQNWCAAWVDSECVQRNFDFVVVLGDVSESGGRRQLEDAKGILEGLDWTLPYVPVIGNHDVYGDWKAASAQNFETVFANELKELCLHPGFSDCSDDGPDPLYLQDFSFVYRGVKVIGLDFVTRAAVALPTVRSATLEWLKEELSEHSGEATPAILLAHHPLLASHEHLPFCVGSCFLPCPPFDEDCKDITAIKDAIFAGKGASGYHVVSFGGHVHGYGELTDLPVLGNVFNANRDFPAGKTAVGIRVVITEATMAGSNQEGKDFIRIVNVDNENAYPEEMHGSFLPALNPYLPDANVRIWSTRWWGWRVEFKPEWYTDRPIQSCQWDFSGEGQTLKEPRDRNNDGRFSRSECKAEQRYRDPGTKKVCLTLNGIDTTCRTFDIGP
jgi:hypothetical protein